MIEILTYGKMLAKHGYVEANLGNISKKIDDEHILISGKGIPLDQLGILTVHKIKNDINNIPKEASSESIVHLSIYALTKTEAIIHTHPLYAVVLSLTLGRYKSTLYPEDEEGVYYLKDIPSVIGASGSSELAYNVSQALKERKCVLVRGHGLFAIGDSLEEAYNITLMVEHSCKIKYLKDMYFSHDSKTPT